MLIKSGRSRTGQGTFSFHLFLYALFFLILFNVQPASALTTIYNDPAGDNYYPGDIIGLDASVDSEKIAIRLIFSPSTTFSSFNGQVYLDTDQNPQTGQQYPDRPDVGYEYVVSLYRAPVDQMVEVYDTNNTLVATVPASFSGQTISFSVLLSDLGNDDGSLNASVLCGVGSMQDEWLPNSGHIALVPTVPSWSVNSVNPASVAMADWPSGQHDLPAQGNYLKIATHYYYVANSTAGSWSGTDYHSVTLQQCDQITGAPLADPTNPSQPLLADLTGMEGRAIELFSFWPFAPWTVNSVSSTSSDSIDWLSSQHAPLAYAGGQYVMIGGIYYATVSSSPGSWNGSNYNSVTLKQCDQSTGTPLTDPANPNAPLPADLTGTSGLPVQFLLSWPPVAWNVFSVDSYQAGSIDWYAAQRPPLLQGHYVKIGTSYYYVESSGANSPWNGSTNNFARLQQCDQLTGMPFTQQNPNYPFYSSDPTIPVWADMTGTEGQAITLFTTWPVPLPTGWTIHSVDPGYPSAFDWYAGQHAVLGQGNYVKIGTTYYYVSYSWAGSWNDNWGSPTVYYNTATLQQCDQLTGMPLTQPDPSNPGNRMPVMADLTGTEGQAIELFIAWPGEPSILINNGANLTSSSAVTLSLSCPDSVNGCTAAEMQFSNDNVNWSTPEPFATSKNWTLTDGDGLKTVYVQFKGGTDNWLIVYSDTIILDAGAPLTVAGPAGGTYLLKQWITLTASETATIYYTTDGSEPTAASPVYTAPLFVDSSLTLKFYAVDSYGNAEAVKTEIYTITHAAIWTKLEGTSANDYGRAIATDTLSNVYVAGYMQPGDSSLGYNNYSDILLVKYDQNGNKIWKRGLGSNREDRAYGIATDNAGNAYVAGVTYGSVDGNVNAGSDDILLAKYDTSGNKLWTRQMGSSGIDAALAVAVDSAGNAYVTGYTAGSLDGNISAGADDIFIAKYDANGNKLWTRQLGTSRQDIAWGVAVDNAGNAVVTGFTDGSMDGNVNAGSIDSFLVKFDTNGNKLWTKQFGSTSNDYAHAVAVDANGNAYITGSTNGGLDGNVNAGSMDVFLVKYSPDGQKVWTRQIGTAGDDDSWSLATDLVGNVYLSGEARGDFEGYVNSGNTDAFIAKYDQGGNWLWTKQLGSSLNDYAFGIAIDQNGFAYVGGHSEGKLDGITGAGLYDLFVIKMIGGDVTSPSVTIVSPSAGVTRNNMPLLSYTVSDGTVVVKVDGVIVNKVSGDSLDLLSDGTHTVRVESTDAAGNTGFAEINFTVDTTPPIVSIASPAALSNDNTPLLSYSASDGTVVVKVDGIAVNKVSENDLDPLGDGTHSVRVESTDTVGNTGFAEVTFTIDTIAPAVSIASPATGLTKDNTPLLAYTVNDGNVIVKVDGTIVNKVSGDNLEALTDGSHAVRVEAKDAAGNTGFREVTFTVDTVTIVSVNVVVSPTKVNIQTLSGNKESGATVSVAVDTAAIVGVISYPASTTWSVQISNLIEGANNITITASDPAGNSAMTATAITYDATPPVVNISSPLAGLTNDNTPLLTYTVSDGTVVVKVDGVVVPKLSGDSFDVLADGSHTVRVEATDTAGNIAHGGIIFVVDTIAPSVAEFRKIAAGGYHTVALQSDGSLWAWGDNSYGQLGDGSIVDKLSPVQIGTGNGWISIAAGINHTVALKADGTLWSWGWNLYGQLGDGTTVNKVSPAQVGEDRDWVSVAAHGAHTVALKSDGTLWDWGSNFRGELGDGTTVHRHSPIQIGSENTWISIAAGEYHTMALKSDGSLWTWGSNFNGELGDGTKIDKKTPIQIGIDNNWIAIVAGDFHSIALKTNGTLWGWGDNNFGQVGDGAYSDRLSPIQIGTDNKWTSISAGGQHTLAIKSDGTLWAWGSDYYGQLGSGSATSKLVPIQIGIDNNWTSIQAGGGHSTTLKRDGNLWTSGRNDDGQLGDGTRIKKTYFVQIGTAGKLTVENGATFTNYISVTINITATDANGLAEMQFSNDGVTWSSPEPYATTKNWTLELGDGTKTVSVKFKDNAGNWSAAYSDSIILDTTAPAVQITLPASGLTNDNTPLLTFAASDGAVVVKVDGVSVNKVSGDSLDALADGPHTLRIESLDAAGNIGSEEVAFTVDTVSPPVSITSPTSGITNNNAPLLIYTVSEGTVVVKVNALVVNKTSGNTLDPLADGQHTVRVESTDTAGNTGYADVSFTVDTVAPSAAINPVITPTNLSNQTITGTMESGATVTVAVNTTATVGPVTYPSPTTWSCAITGLVEGGNNITVTTTDPANNTATAATSITFDSVAPTVSITSPAAGVTNDNTPLLIFDKGDGTAVVKVDEAIVNTASGQSLDALADGSHTVRVESTDAAGNNAFAEVSFSVDTVPPSVNISPVTTLTNVNNQTVTGNRENGATVTVVVNTSASVGSVTYPTATTWSCAITGLVEGANNITVTATDAANNSATAAASIAYDSVAPTVSITSPATGVTNDNTPLLTFDKGDGTAVVKVDGAIVNTASDQSLDALADGSHTVRVESADAAGNTGFTEVTFTVDTAPPAVSINPVVTPTKLTYQTITGAMESGATVTVSVNTAATPGSVTYPTATTWSCTISSLVYGLNTITAFAKDAAANTSSATASITEKTH